MITTEDVRRVSRTGEPLVVGPLVITLDNLVRLPASDWDDWMELRAFAARREARRLSQIAKLAERLAVERAAVESGGEVIEGEVIEEVREIEAPPRVRRKRGHVSTPA